MNHRFVRRLADGSTYHLGTAVQYADGWRFLSNVASHKNSRKFHPTMERCLPRWVGYPDRCESVVVGGPTDEFEPSITALTINRTRGTDMAKLRNVTFGEFNWAREQASEIAQLADDLHRRASQGYADEWPNPAQMAMVFASASRALADLSSWCLSRAALAEQKLAIEMEFHKRSKTAS